MQNTFPFSVFVLQTFIRIEQPILSGDTLLQSMQHNNNFRYIYIKHHNLIDI